jgi:Phospholipase_D-nuclease N-terminal
MEIWIGVLGLIALICAVWVIVDVLSKRRMNGAEKALWVICAIFFSILTAIVYYFVKVK